MVCCIDFKYWDNNFGHYVLDSEYTLIHKLQRSGWDIGCVKVSNKNSGIFEDGLYAST